MRELLNNTERDKSIVLFGGWFGQLFTDNARFLFQYLSNNKRELNLNHVVWVTSNETLCSELKSMGYEAYDMYSSESVYFHKKAYYHIICNNSQFMGEKNTDLLVQYSNGAVKINLWHGLGGLKGVGYASRGYLAERSKHYLKCVIGEKLNYFKVYRQIIDMGGWRDCYYFSTSMFSASIMQKYFNVPVTKILISSYPRTKQCLKFRSSEIEILDRLKTRNNIILYVPTFRESVISIEDPISSSKFVDFIEQNDITWISKKHSAEKSKSAVARNSENIIILDDDFDINILYKSIDLLISDYSSAVWDALYYDLPVIFYAPDLKKYQFQDRGFLLKPAQFLIGKLTRNIDQLTELLRKYNSQYKKLIPDNYPRLKKRMWGDEYTYKEIWNSIRNLHP